MMNLLKAQLSDPHCALVVAKSGGHKAHPDKKHCRVRKKRYSFGYTVFLILALMKLLCKRQT